MSCFAPDSVDCVLINDMCPSHWSPLFHLAKQKSHNNMRIVLCICIPISATVPFGLAGACMGRAILVDCCCQAHPQQIDLLLKLHPIAAPTTQFARSSVTRANCNPMLSFHWVPKCTTNTIIQLLSCIRAPKYSPNKQICLLSCQ